MQWCFPIGTHVMVSNQFSSSHATSCNGISSILLCVFMHIPSLMPVMGQQQISCSLLASFPVSGSLMLSSLQVKFWHESDNKISPRFLSALVETRHVNFFFVLKKGHRTAEPLSFCGGTVSLHSRYMVNGWLIELWFLWCNSLLMRSFSYFKPLAVHQLKMKWAPFVLLESK